jgi:hypothetical protein
LAIAAASAAIAMAGCGDDGDDAGDRDDKADPYALEVERLTDDVDRYATTALTALNGVADGSRPRGPVEASLESLSEQVTAAQTELDGLPAPEETGVSADDLAFAVGDLARHLDTVATDLRVAKPAGVHAAANSGARLVLSSKSSVSALSRAVRRLADQAED